MDLGESSLTMLNTANLSKKNKDLVKLLCTQELKRQKLKLERAKLIEINSVKKHAQLNAVQFVKNASQEIEKVLT